MNTRAHLARLQQLTGRLLPSPDAPDELGRFERTLAQHLRDNADLTIQREPAAGRGRRRAR